MSRMSPCTSITKVATVVASTAALSAVVALPSPAQAGSFSLSRESGRMVAVEWLEVGVLRTPAGDVAAPGNVHFGDVMITQGGRSSTPLAFGSVIDLQCPDGVIPERPGHGHGVEPALEEPPAEEPLCEHRGMRFIHGGNLTMTMDRKLTTAHVTGTLAVHGESGEAAAPIDATWTGLGSVYSSTGRGTETFDGQTYSYRYSFTGRDAAVTGKMGPMDFTDDADDVSTGRMGSFKNAYRSRTR